jgi:hypothetical protein
MGMWEIFQTEEPNPNPNPNTEFKYPVLHTVTALQVADLTMSEQVYDWITKIYKGTNTNSTVFYMWVEMMY